MEKIINVGGRLHNPVVGGALTGADEIKDDLKGKMQSVINQETDAALVQIDEGKQDKLTFDQTPTENSTNPVTSGGVYAADAALQQAIEAILLLIPSAASALNQLADKSFVNSSIATATATFRGTYNLVTDLELTVSATHQQIAAALASVVSTADNNDYCFVQIPVSDQSSDIRVTERYKFDGTSWGYEYDLNNSGFTADQWGAINSGITSVLVGKLGGLPTAQELATMFAGKQNTLAFDSTPVAGSDNPVKSSGLYNAFAAINALIPSGADANNKLVAESRLVAYVTTLINALDATFNVTSADGHVTLRMTQANGVITSVQILTSDIASAPALTTLAGRVSMAESDIDALQDAYAALTQSDIVVVNGDLPSSGQQQNIIYRQPEQEHTPPQFYSDYMWNGTTWVLMATYNNAIDDEPTDGSDNLVKSGGVVSYVAPIKQELSGHTETYEITAGGGLNKIFPLSVKSGKKFFVSVDSDSLAGVQLFVSGSFLGTVMNGEIGQFTSPSDADGIQLYAMESVSTPAGYITVFMYDEDSVVYTKQVVKENTDDIADIKAQINEGTVTLHCQESTGFNVQIPFAVKTGDELTIRAKGINSITEVDIYIGGTSVGSVKPNDFKDVTSPKDSETIQVTAIAAWVKGNGDLQIIVTRKDGVSDKAISNKQGIGSNTSLITDIMTDSYKNKSYVYADAVGGRYCLLPEKLFYSGKYNLQFRIRGCAGQTISKIALYAAPGSEALTDVLFEGAMTLLENDVILRYDVTASHEAFYFAIEFTILYQDWEVTVDYIYENKTISEFLSDYNSIAKVRKPYVKDMNEWKALNSGLFMHWGVYSTTGGVYQGLNVYGETVSINTDSVVVFRDSVMPKQTYKDYQAQFTAANWNADEIARMAYDAGMQYICITAKHAEGFVLFDDENADWNISTAAARNTVLDELKAACDKYGLKFCLYFNQSYDWMSEGGYGQEPWNNGIDPYTEEQHLAFLAKQQNLLRAMYERFDPYYVWFDTGISGLAINAYNDWRKNYSHIIINDRMGGNFTDFKGDFKTGEGSLYAGDEEYFENCASSGLGSWGYQASYDDANNVQENMRHLCFHILNSIAMGGNSLLNVAPKGDGSICTSGLGFLNYMKNFVIKNGVYHGDSVFGKYDQPDWGRIIRKGNCIQCYVMVDTSEVRIDGIYNKFAKSAYLNSNGSQLTLTKNNDYSMVVSGIPQAQNEIVVITVDFSRKPMGVSYQTLLTTDSSLQLMAFFPVGVQYFGFYDKVPYVKVDSASQSLKCRRMSEFSGQKSITFSRPSGHTESYTATLEIKNVSTGSVTSLEISNASGATFIFTDSTLYELTVKIVSGTLYLSSIDLL